MKREREEEEKNQAYHLLEAIKSDQLERAYTLVQQLSFARYAGAPRKEEYKEQAAWLKQQRDAAKENLSAIQSFFTVTPDLMVEQMQKAQPIVTALAELTLEFMVALNQHKKNKGVLEFNDLEHDALAILQGEDQLGSEASIYYRQQFKEVLVDEYQDVNRLQEAILSWVRHTETEVGNQFMVGDVKQSIYAFRLADPTLFIEKYLDYENETGGRRIILAENFRSRSEVLHLTNYIFQQLMDEELGQIPYDQSAELVPGFPDFPESTHFAPELLLYEKGEKEEELLETPDLPEFTFDGKTEGELLMVALKIQQLVQEKFEIYDKKRKENRPVTYRDIVLLAPTRSNNLTLIDTPGILDDGNIANYVTPKKLLKIIPDKEIKPITYQINKKQYILIEDILKIETGNNDLTLYFSNKLNIKRIYKDIPSDLFCHNISVNRYNDIVITGMGFIKSKKKENIKIYTLEGVDIYTRDSLI